MKKSVTRPRPEKMICKSNVSSHVDKTSVELVYRLNQSAFRIAFIIGLHNQTSLLVNVNVMEAALANFCN